MVWHDTDEMGNGMANDTTPEKRVHLLATQLDIEKWGGILPGNIYDDVPGRAFDAISGRRKALLAIDEHDADVLC
jgi:hypothetical protein